ncbi:FliM/FliN family flagellar motor switch protein [Pseudohaliea sp.]|uniref:flagellar motor switch protein FliM n=1 Tax=Pseudohaliea sp. TaxID=2740289 RepID=UPI0032F086A2
MADSEILNEDEINALTREDTAAEGSYRPFDFTARERSVLGQFAALAGINQRHADLLASALSDTFSIEFELQPQSLQLSSYGDLAVSVGPVVGVASAEVAPLAGHCHVLMAGDFLSLLVNDYFGGGRSGPPAARERSALTPSELRLAERVAGLSLDTMAAAWADKLALTPGELSVAPTPDRLEAQPARDVALLIGFDITAGEFRSQLQLALPLAALESHRERFAPPRRSAETGPGWEPYFRRELRAVPLELTGVLCTREYALADLLALRVGSVLPLEMPGEVELLVEGEPLASGSYGTHEGRKAIKITRLALAKAAGNGGKS